MTRAPAWDIADAASEGIDLAAFLRDCPRLALPEPEPEPPAPDADPVPEGVAPFRCIGYDSSTYHFLKGAQRIPYSIPMGNFNASKLGELAPASWWGLAYQAVTKEGGIYVARAQSAVIDEETRRGFFRPDSLRGSGVWLDDGRIIINDGSRIVDAEGRAIPLAEYEGPSAYIRSTVEFGDMTGDTSEAEEGERLAELVDAQEWITPMQGMAALGWALIAPFGGVLSWRPHLWLTGKRGTGKTWVKENIIEPLCGPFAHCGSGKDTEAGIRRTLKTDARPVILDETEGNTKSARESVSKILSLSRNASSDNSGRVTMASGQDGTVSFIVRSCFCLASVNVATGEGSAIASRIILSELKAPQNEREKIERSRSLMDAMKDPARYRRRIFRALPRILEDIKALADFLPTYLGGRREADTWAPLFAAAWAVQSDESIQGDEGIAWLMPYLSAYLETTKESAEDEDRVIEHILGAQIETDDRKKRTVAELLAEVWTNDAESAATLMRHGIRLRNSPGGWQLCIAKSSDQLRRILQGTPYESGYDAQIRRNSCCIDPEKGGVNLRMAGRQTWCQVLDWNRFKATYLGDIGEGRLGFEKDSEEARG